ncbi:MAG: shufflon system plasmid conjugative transfer pilus tip adhesin PilV, partial [Cupriavidus sp.]
MNTVQSKQKGLSLLEVLASIAITTLIMGYLAGVVNDSMGDVKAQQAARYQSQTTAATRKWLSVAANRATVQAAATTTTPYKIPLASLAAYLPAGFQNANPFNQTPCLLAYYNSATGKIDVAATTEGGTVIRDAQVSYIAGLAGDGAGAIKAAAPTIASGAYGGWQVTVSTYTSAVAAKNCSGTPAAGGHLFSLIAADSAGTITTDFLARNLVPGHPEANQMNTAIDMNSNALNNVSQISIASGDTILLGNTRIGSDPNNLLLKSAPGAAVSVLNTAGAYTTLNAGNLNAYGNIVATGSISTGSTVQGGYLRSTGNGQIDGNLTVNGNASVGGSFSANGDIVSNNGSLRAPTGRVVAGGNDGGQAGAVYASNWLRTYGNTGWYSETYAGGWYMSDSGWVRSYLDKGVYTGGEIQGGTVRSWNWFRSMNATGWYNETYAGGVYMADGTYVRTYNGKAFLVEGDELRVGVGNNANEKRLVLNNSARYTYIYLSGGGDVGLYDASSGLVRWRTDTSGNMFLANSLSVPGNVDVAGTVWANNWFRSRGATGWLNESYGGGFYMSDATWIRAYNDKSIYTGGVIAGGLIQSNGRVIASEYVEIRGTATQGSACSPNGLVAKDSNGAILSCNAGLWPAPTANLPSCYKPNATIGTVTGNFQYISANNAWCYGVVNGTQFTGICGTHN